MLAAGDFFESDFAESDFVESGFDLAGPPEVVDDSFAVALASLEAACFESVFSESRFGDSLESVR